jgi:carboxyl-terminal processing protease
VKRKPDDSWDYWLDPKAKIAYIHLSEFAPRSFEDIEDVMKQLKKDGLRGIILDLRFNPGGSLTGAVQISDLFIQDGLIVTIKPRSGVDEEVAYTGKVKRPEHDFSSYPMVCLINGQSASASEIVSACLQDQQRATILGERSFGKGSVQTIVDFPTTGAKIKLTTATFWRPNGKNLHKADTSGKAEEDWGVAPDEGFVMPLSREERLTLGDKLRDLEIIPNPALKKEPKPEVKDRQLEAALKQVRKQLGDDPEPKKKAESNTPAAPRG